MTISLAGQGGDGGSGHRRWMSLLSDSESQRVSASDQKLRFMSRSTEPPGKQTLFLTSCPSYFSWQEGFDSILCGLNHRSHQDLEMEKSMIHKNISECP